MDYEAITRTEGAPLLGTVLLMGLSEEFLSRRREACGSVARQLVVASRVSEARPYAMSPAPTVLLASSTPRIDSSLFSRSDEAMQRVAVVVVAPDRAEADYWKNIAWDAFEAGADDGLVRDVLASAMAEAEKRREEWAQVDDFRRRFRELSPEELGVLEAVCNGKLNKQIAGEFGVSIRTVEQRRRRVFTKMGVESAVPLADRLATVRALQSQSRRCDAARHVAPKPNLLSSLGVRHSLVNEPGEAR